MAYKTNLNNKLSEKVNLTDLEVIVKSINDLPTPDVDGKIYLEDNLTYKIKGIITTNITIVVGVSNTIFGLDKSTDGFIYTGTGNLFEVTNKTLSAVNLFLAGMGGATCQLFSVVNISIYSFQVRECIIAGDCQAGTINGGNIIAINNNIHAGTLSYGWDTKGVINKCGIDSNYFENIKK